MTQILSTKSDKSEVVDSLRKLLQLVTFPFIGEANRSAILQHFDWMKRQPGNLYNNCKIETVPELQLTRITLELSFGALPPMEKRQ